MPINKGHIEDIGKALLPEVINEIDANTVVKDSKPVRIVKSILRIVLTALTLGLLSGRSFTK